MLGDISGQLTQPGHMTLLQDQLFSMVIEGKASFPCLRGSEQNLLSRTPLAVIRKPFVSVFPGVQMWK